MEAKELDELVEVLRADCLDETVEEWGEDVGCLVRRQHLSRSKVQKLSELEDHRDFPDRSGSCAA